MILFNFSLLDWIIVVIVVYSMARSWYKGFAKEIIWLITIVAAVLAAAWFYRGAGNLFKDVARTENIALFLGFSFTFLATIVAGLIVMVLVARFMKFAKLQRADQLLGAAFGFIRGWMISAAMLLALTAFDIQTERLKNSELAPYFLPGSRVIAVMTPYELKAKFMAGYYALDRLRRQQ
jgi:membrane protein required for colicin V production